MAKHIPIGVRGEAEETVQWKHTLSAHHPDLPPVYSTPDMIRLMEVASFQALQPFCEEGEITVGISIHVEHRAASGIGSRIRAEAELESFDGRFYTMRVVAHDMAHAGAQVVGRGTVGRAVVHVPSFVAKMRENAGKGGQGLSKERSSGQGSSGKQTSATSRNEKKGPPRSESR